MDTTDLKHLYEAPGPFATTLLDVSHDSESAETENALRVRHACEQLAEQGAPEELVETVRGALEVPTQWPAPVGRMVVANASGVLLDDVVRMRVDRPTVSVGPLPDLTAWIAHKDAARDFVLAVVDHEGGAVARYDADIPWALQEDETGGETLHLQKVSSGGWSELAHQRDTEHVWAQNAQDTAERIHDLAEDGVGLVLLAGDAKARSLVVDALDHLGALRADLVQLESGSRAEDGGDAALQEAARAALVEHTVGRIVQQTHELRDRLGQGSGAAAGVDDVLDALVRGQVDTLLLARESAAEHEVDLSGHPGLTIGQQRSGELRLDQVTVAAAALTDAAVTVVPDAVLAQAPVAALLRWDQAPAT